MIETKKKSPEHAILSRTILDNNYFKFNRPLHGVEWKMVIRSNLPFLNKARSDYILSLAGAYSLNPLILVTTVMVDEELSKPLIDTDDDDFRHRIRLFADTIARSHLENFKSDGVLTSIRVAFGGDHEKLEKFVELYNKLHNENGLSSAKEKETNVWLTERDEDLNNTMQWPWPPNQCWEVSATHGGNLEGLSTYIPASLDMGPSLFTDWLQNYDFLGYDQGTVVSAHAGVIYKHSSCSLEIRKGRYSTYYGHVNVIDTLENGTFVKMGDKIGEIELRPDRALCLCDWEKKKFSCSNGPHLHFEVRKDGMPISLNNMVIGGIQIRAGKYERDASCTDPEHCLLAKDAFDLPCATYFSDEQNNIYCPSVRGNTGMN